MLLHWLWLAHRPGISDRVKMAVLERYGDAEDAFYADRYEVEGLTPEGLDALRDKSLSEAKKILAQCTDKDIHILTWSDENYPARLRNISDPPLVLYYKGTLPDLNGPLIGVVGTRGATGYGLNAARRLGYQLGKSGATLVSGGAAGVDTVAMKGALAAEGTVIGVLGCGADVVYPASNRWLYGELERRGCLLTEYPPETPPLKWNFPKRNRIISGLSCGVLVVEAPVRSGSLITARLAAEQGRDVFVVPGNIDVPTCAGSNALLRDGAMAVTDGWDILGEYEAVFPDKLHRVETDMPLPEIVEEPELKVAQKPRLPRKERPSRRKKDKKVIDNSGQPPYIDVEKSLSGLSAEEQAIVERLKQGQCLTDTVIADTGLPSGKVLSVLTMLQVKGIIKRLPGNWVALK